VRGLNKAFVHKIRVRYCDTDKMALVYHSKYLDYFEWARTEYIRSKGKSYDQLEKEGYFLPCSKLDIQYHKPAKYDDELEVFIVGIESLGVRMTFSYEIKRAGDLLITGSSTHVFTTDEFKPCKPPKNIQLS
jgi:acyl-CoA thioester hydrolase